MQLSRRTPDPGPRTPRLGPRPFSISLVNSFGGNFVWMPSRFTHRFQAEPCRCSRRVASIIERIDLGCASNPMRVLISLTAPSGVLRSCTHCLVFIHLVGVAVSLQAILKLTRQMLIEPLMCYALHKASSFLPLPNQIYRNVKLKLCL